MGTGRGVMKYYASGADLAKDMGVPVQTLADTHELHYQASVKTAADPDGGSWPAYPSGKSWDEPSGKTGSGKKFYHNVIDGSKVAAEPFYVAIITPVIHYCMGGLHGNNRLGGNSLLDCVVYGRVAGRFAATYMFGKDGKFKMYPIDAKDKSVSNVIIN